MYHSTNRYVNKLLHRCWNHSARVAAIAAVLASGVKGLSSDQAILAGLIHDIGKLPLIVHAEKIPELIEDESAMRVLFLSLHADVGNHVLKNWNFPEELVDVAKHHENISYSHNSGPNYTDIIIIANLYSYYGCKHFVAETEWDSIHAFECLEISPTSDFIENTDNIAAISEVELILTS